MEGKFHNGVRFPQGQRPPHATNRGFANDFPRPQGISGVAPIDVCPICGKSHRGPYLKSSNACFDCGELGHKRMDYPRNRGKGRGANAVPFGRGGSQGGSPKHNRSYAIYVRQGVGEVPDVVTGILQNH